MAEVVGNVGRRELAIAAAYVAIYGKGMDPFEHPEGWEYATTVADAVLGSFPLGPARDAMVSDAQPRFSLEPGKLAEHYAIPMILHCPQCGERHIDEQDFAEVAHHTHACQGCGFVWRPAKVNTHGVRFLPGYINAANRLSTPGAMDASR